MLKFVLVAVMIGVPLMARSDAPSPRAAAPQVREPTAMERVLSDPRAIELLAILDSASDDPEVADRKLAEYRNRYPDLFRAEQPSPQWPMPDEPKLNWKPKGLLADPQPQPNFPKGWMGP